MKPATRATTNREPCGRTLLVRLLLVTACVASCSCLCSAVDPESTFDSANRLYEQGKFAEAASGYAQIIQSGQGSAPLYFNLGNAFFKAGQIGRAILAYRHANAIAARDPEVLANLRFARNQVQGPTFTRGPVARWLQKMTLNEWTIASAAAVWVWFLLLILPQWRPPLRPALHGWTITAGIVAVLFCACFGVRMYQAQFQPTAVIVSSEAPLHQAPFAESPCPTSLHDGAEVLVLDRNNDWLQVSTDPRRIGWIQRDQAVLLKAD